ncbi:MAG: hypothetical protein LQ345_007022 [Seirophora villosa]|nr:MAG: hypothetical protein LQ345_007022 [Seirophora villosa]
MALNDDICAVSPASEKEHPPGSSPSLSRVEGSRTDINGTTSPSTSPVDEDPHVYQDYLTHAFGRLEIQQHLPMAQQMFAALRAAFQHAVETHHLEIGSRWQERLRQADEDSRRGTRDLEILMWIRTVLEQLHYLESADLIDAMNALADGSRDATADLAQCPEYSLQIILQFMQEQKQALDPSDMLQLISTANAFLQQQRFQVHFVEQGLVTHLLDAIIDSYTYENERPEAQEELSFLRSSITRLLSDVSATAVFANKYSVGSPVVASLIHWLSDPRDQMRICSCLMLGNLARSDAVCLNMVRRLRLHERLLEIMREQTGMQVVYAALSFLRNLALPAENKAMIGTLQLIEVISSLWSLNLNPQVQHASVSLLRQILNGCIGNVRWLLESLSPDPDSPAHEKTYLSLLLLLFGRTDDVSTKVEIGRTVATICRCIATSSQGLPQGSTSAILHRLYAMHVDIARPLAMMTTQSRFPIIRSEGWFALALMARSKEGSAAVSEVLHQMEVFGALVTTITGQSTNGHSSPSAQQRSNTGNTSRSGSNSIDTRSEQEREMQAKDRENALVLVNELLKNTGDEVSVIRRSILQDLMHGPQSPAGAQELMTRAESEDRAE